MPGASVNRRFRTGKHQNPLGKTTFIAELIDLYQNIFPTARILLSSQTYIALDHVIIKLLEKGMEQVIVRIYDERLENIDERVLSLTLDIKTRAWIERVEERAREHLRTQAKQLGLDTGACAIEKKRVGEIPGAVIPA